MKKSEEERLFKKFKKRIEAEKKARQKADLDWTIRFEEEPRGNFQGGWREHEDPGRDWDDR